MLNTFSAKTYQKIRNLEGNTNLENTNVLQPIDIMRKSKVLPGNNILSAGFSMHNIVNKVENTMKKVGKDTGNQVIKSIPSVVTKSFEGAVVPALSKYGEKALTQYLMPAATIAAEDAPLALLAAGRKIARAISKAKKEQNNHNHSKEEEQEKGAGIKGMRPTGTMAWTEHVKKYRAQHGGTYKEALLGASESYKKVKKAMKPIKIKK